MDAIPSSAAPSVSKQKRSLLLWKIGFLVSFSLLLLEGTLRVGQKVGVITDLEMKDVSITVISDELNHVPAIDGIHYDEYGIKNYSSVIDAAVLHQNQARKILFMGDSFIFQEPRRYTKNLRLKPRF